MYQTILTNRKTVICKLRKKIHAHILLTQKIIYRNIIFTTQQKGRTLMKQKLNHLLTTLLVLSLLFTAVPATTVTAASKKPEQVTITTVTRNNSYKKLTVRYNPVTKAKGYQVAYKVKSAKKWTYKNVSASKKSVTVTVKPNKIYNVKVRAYTKSNGRKLYGKWSETVVSHKKHTHNYNIKLSENVTSKTPVYKTVKVEETKDVYDWYYPIEEHYIMNGYPYLDMYEYFGHNPSPEERQQWDKDHHIDETIIWRVNNTILVAQGLEPEPYPYDDDWSEYTSMCSWHNEYVKAKEKVYGVVYTITETVEKEVLDYYKVKTATTYKCKYCDKTKTKTVTTKTNQ